jgi:rubrerythrin
MQEVKMERILGEASVVEIAKQLEEGAREFYEKLAARSEQAGMKDFFEALAKQKAIHSRNVDQVSDFVKGQEESIQGYEEKFHLYLTPSLGSWIFADFAKKMEGVKIEDLKSSLSLLTEFEKEALLFYYGMKEVLPQSARSVVDEMVNQRREDILALQNLAKEMTSNVDDLLLVALDSELMAKRFYRNASAKAKSNAGRKFFQDLSDFEQAHFEKIKKIIEQRGKGMKLESLGHEPVIETKPEIEGEFEPNKDEIADVLILGIKAEKGAQERYRKLASIIDDPEGKKIFEELAEAEKMHQKVLEDEFYSISNKGTIVWGE